MGLVHKNYKLWSTLLRKFLHVPHVSFFLQTITAFNCLCSSIYLLPLYYNTNSLCRLCKMQTTRSLFCLWAHYGEAAHSLFSNNTSTSSSENFNIHSPLNIEIQGVYKRMVRFQKVTRNLFLTLHCHNVHRQQRKLSKFLMRYQQFASHA